MRRIAATQALFNTIIFRLNSAVRQFPLLYRAWLCGYARHCCIVCCIRGVVEVAGSQNRKTAMVGGGMDADLCIIFYIVTTVNADYQPPPIDSGDEKGMRGMGGRFCCHTNRMQPHQQTDITDVWRKNSP